MTFYSCSTLLAELLMLAMTLHVLHYSGFTKQQKTWYLLTFLAIMVCAAMEFAVHGGIYTPSLALPLTVLTVIQFSVAPMLGVLFTGALGLHSRRRTAVTFLVVNLLVETLSAPFGLIFYFDQSGYFRGRFFFLYEAMYVASLIYLIAGMVTVGRNFRHRDVWTIGMVLVILVAGILPMTFYRINVTYIAIAISASLCYIYYNDLVQQDVKEELLANQQKLSDMQEHMISGLANLIESRDMETGEHIARTSAYVKQLAEDARNDGVYADRLDDRFISMLYTLAPMHDIGKILVPDSILRKPGKLTREEFEKMKEHAAVGGTVVREVLNGVTDEDYVTFASDVATYHHEWWDGSGYPNGLAGEDIPLCARIMAIADVFDALISKRCYKSAMPPDEAFQIIQAEAGTHFDPQLAAVFLSHKNDFIL